MNRDAYACRSGVPAPRRTGDLSAMHNAYLSGHVFSGDTLGIPMIDLRPYLEDELNMHNARQSFSTRKRLLNGLGHAENQAIWFTGSEADVPARITDALRVLDAYLTSGKKPAAVADACWDSNGVQLAVGADVLDGILNVKEPGICSQTYPIYSSSRMVAGDDFAGDKFECALMSVDEAIVHGLHGSSSFDPLQRNMLNTIFPEGVCDYSKPDVGKPHL